MMLAVDNCPEMNAGDAEAAVQTMRRFFWCTRKKKKRNKKKQEAAGEC